MKKILSVLLLIALTSALMLPVAAAERIPDSKSFNGLLSDGSMAISHPTVESGNVDNSIAPRLFLGYDYKPGYEELRNFEIIHEYKYLWGTSVSFVEGASPTYTVSTTRTSTTDTKWSIQGNLGATFDFDKAEVELAVAGDYETVDTAQIVVGEEWDCDFTIPGLYDLTWYQRGHSYDAYCGAIRIATDSSDGQFEVVKVGTLTFPTKEVHFDVSYA